jgi:uncharacterized RDD family membrane protein YckC
MDQVPEPPSVATESVPPAPAAQEDLLGRRSAAALIDVALLTGVFLIFSLTVGEIRTQGEYSATLNGAWSGVYLGVVLWYFFVFEVAVGQSVGKRLLGLRVTRADGSRPSAAAISVRRCCGWWTGCRFCTWSASSRCWPPARSGANGWAIWRPRRG